MSLADYVSIAVVVGLAVFIYVVLGWEMRRNSNEEKEFEQTAKELQRIKDEWFARRWVPFSWCFASWEVCNYCDGSGKCVSCSGGGTEDCRLCNGAGGETCSSCNGWGTQSEDCDCGEECGGTIDVDCDECDGDGETRCSECDGQGWVDCSSCNGTTWCAFCFRGTVTYA